MLFQKKNTFLEHLFYSSYVLKVQTWHWSQATSHHGDYDRSLGIIHQQLASPFFIHSRFTRWESYTKPLCPPFCGGHGNPLGSPIKCPSLGLRQSQVWLSPPIVRRRASYSQSSLQRTSLHKFSLISKNPTVSTPDVNVYLRERKLVFLIFFSAN